MMLLIKHGNLPCSNQIWEIVSNWQWEEDGGEKRRIEKVMLETIFFLTFHHSVKIDIKF